MEPVHVYNNKKKLDYKLTHAKCIVISATLSDKWEDEYILIGNDVIDIIIYLLGLVKLGHVIIDPSAKSVLENVHVLFNNRIDVQMPQGNFGIFTTKCDNLRRDSGHLCYVPAYSGEHLYSNNCSIYATYDCGLLNAESIPSILFNWSSKHCKLVPIPAHIKCFHKKIWTVILCCRKRKINSRHLIAHILKFAYPYISYNDGKWKILKPYELLN